MDYQKESPVGYDSNSRDVGTESGVNEDADFFKLREKVLGIPLEKESRAKIEEDREADPANGKAAYRALLTDFKKKYSIARPEEIDRYKEQEPDNLNIMRLRPVALLRRELNETDLQRVSQLLEITSVKEMLEEMLERDRRDSEAQKENDLKGQQHLNSLLKNEQEGFQLTTNEDRELGDYRLRQATKKDRPGQTDFERNKKELDLKDLANSIAIDLMQLDEIVGRASQTEPAFGENAKDVAKILYKIQGNYNAYLRIKKNKPGLKTTLINALGVSQV